MQPLIMYAIFADIVAFAHLIFVAFAIGGQLAILLGIVFRWSWARNFTFRILHVLSVIFVAFEAAIGMVCPLTLWEYILRERAGEFTNRNVTFIERLVNALLYYDLPAWVFKVSHLVFGALVLFTFIVYPPRRTKKRNNQ